MKKQKKQAAKKKKQAPQNKQSAPAVKKAQPISLPAPPEGKRLALHFMHGAPANASLCKDFKPDHWHNTRLAEENADIACKLDDVRLIPDASCDGVWLQNILPQLTYPDVIPFLQQVRRILRPAGTLLAMMPDLQKLAETMRDKGLERSLVPNTPKGPAIIDFLYGARNPKGDGSFRTGFVAHTLANRLAAADFKQVTVKCEGLYLFCKAQKPAPGVVMQDKPKIIAEDVNEMMIKRDEIDVPPAKWDDSIKI